MQSVYGDPVERRVVQDDDAVGRVCEALEREQGVVGLHDNVRDADRVGRVVRRLLIREHRVCLNQLLGVSGKIHLDIV